MVIQQVMQKALGPTMGILHEKAISPDADLTPVYVGKFCYIGKLALDEYDFIDQKILGLAALILAGVVAREKGWSAFQWVPEFILPVAQDKIIGLLANRYMGSTEHGMQFKTEKDRQAFILTSTVVKGVIRTLGIYLMSSRNPNILLRANIPLEIVMVGYFGLFEWCASTIHENIQKHNRKYAYDILVISNMGFYLLVGYVAGKAIEKGVGAPILTNRKFTLISSATYLMIDLLMRSPNSPFNKTQE